LLGDLHVGRHHQPGELHLQERAASMRLLPDAVAPDALLPGTRRAALAARRGRIFFWNSCAAIAVASGPATESTGEGGWDRTIDHLLKRQMLYH
jgi:hypothetical protein